MLRFHKLQHIGTRWGEEHYRTFGLTLEGYQTGSTETIGSFSQGDLGAFINDLTGAATCSVTTATPIAEWIHAATEYSALQVMLNNWNTIDTYGLAGVDDKAGQCELWQYCWKYWHRQNS